MQILGFAKGLIQMFNRLRAMAVEIVLGTFQMMLGVAYRLQGFVNMRCAAGTGSALADVAATVGAAGTGGAGAFGPAATAGNATINKIAAAMSRVSSPIFCMSSYPSEFRFGRANLIHGTCHGVASTPTWINGPVTRAPLYSV